MTEKVKKILSKYKKNILILLLCVIISTIYFVVKEKLGLGNQSVFHPKNEKDNLILILYSLGGWIVLTIILYIVIHIFFQRKTKKEFIKHFLIYFSLMSVFLILLWPGIFKGDEYYTIDYLTNMYFFPLTQHYITSLFYAFSLSIFPTLGTITLLQIFIISLIVGYIFSSIEKKLIHKKLIYIFYIFLLLPPVIDNNLFTLRSSLIAYLFLLTIFELIFYQNDKNIKRLYIAALISCLIGNWKTEFIYMPIAILLFYIFTNLKKIKIKKCIISVIVFAIIFNLISLPQKSNKDYYILTAVINPLSVMSLDKKIENTMSSKDVKKIEKVVTFKQLREWPHLAVYNIPSYWYVTNKKISDKDVKNFLITYAKIVIKDPKSFLIARLKTYRATNFSKANEPVNQTGFEDFSAQWTLKLRKNNYFNENFKYLHGPLSTKQKKELVCLLLQRDSKKYNPSLFNNLFYNVTIILFISLISLIILLIRKKFIDAYIIFIDIAQFFIIFLTAPANFWMYYIVLYISLNMLMSYKLLLLIDKKVK